ncbi:MAG TPA: ATP-binding protein [Clostridia bacterium]|nr:ATP-binding protein [Clostridia bacterium]
MLADELIVLVKDIQRNKCEKQNLELKKAAEGCPQRLYNTLSSFSNQDGGGTVIFGIDEKNYLVCGVYDPQDIQVKVNEQCQQMEPVIRPLFTVANIDGKSVVSCEVQECDIYQKPCFYKGAGRMKGSYIRSGDADMLMTEYEIYSYEIFKRKIQDELRIIERADADVINQDLLSIFFAKLKNAKPNLAKLSEKQILKLTGVMVDSKPTICGTLLFGLYPQGYFPSLCITAVVVPGTQMGDTGPLGERFIDNKKFEGTIPELLEDTLGFIRRNIKTKTIIDDFGNRADKDEYPLKAVREIILNALIHRDYSIHTENSPIRVMMFRDRIEVENPGGLYGRLTINDLGKVGADTRNPYIASDLEILINTENRFSGIPTIYNEMEKANHKPPIFENKRGTFKVILYNEVNLSLSEIESEIIEFCNTGKSRDQIAKFLSFENPSYMIKKYVIPLVEKGLLKMMLPDKPKSKNQKFVSTHHI